MKKNHSTNTKNMRNKAHQTVWNILFYLCAFAVPAIGMMVILFSRHFYPFGENTLFTGDMRSQYAAFFASLRYVADSDNSIFCSFARSWGGNYLGLFAYYLASPLSWIVNLFPIEKLYVGILVLTVIKIGLAGVTFAVFAHLTFLTSGSLSVPDVRRQFLLLPFAVSYALMSYNLVYSQALMWIDGVILLPLVILGAEKLLHGKKGLLLILSLTASFLCNYYTGYMIALFTTLYILFRLALLFCEGHKAIRVAARIALRFVFCGLLAAGLSAPLLIPVALDLFTGKLTGTSVTASGFTSFSIMDFLRQFANGAYNSLTYSNVPYIYCGYLALIFSIAFFFFKTITRREKIGAICMLTTLFLGMYVNKLNILWHGFQMPNSYPFRDSFIFSFFLLYLALRALSSLCDTFPRVTTPGTTTGYALFALLMLFVSVDLGLNGRAMLFHVEDEYDYDTVTDYENYIVTIEPLLSEIKASDDGFYRINQLFEYAKNDAMLWGYNGLSHYSSTYNQSVNVLTKSLGMATDWLWNAGYGTTPLTDSMLSVKYVLARYALPEHYTLLSESGYGTASYQNPTALPIAYSATISDWEPHLGEDVFANQNLLLNAALGEDIDYFSPIPFNISGNPNNTQEWQYTFTADSADPVYLMMPSDAYTYTEVYVNDRFVGNYFSSETTCCLLLGTFAPGETVTVRVQPSALIEIAPPLIYALSMEKLNASLHALGQNGMQITTHKHGGITGTIKIPDGHSIVTSIPYDAGWTVRIDGKKVPATCFADTFLAVSSETLSDVAPGAHTISFNYLSPGFIPGVICFLLAICLGVIYLTPLHRFAK
ncbi:MAG: YfhO family protein [Lachnospiraceae bacterium]|nr:YfhO family protein [Lachnospiraceae bacterium]